MRIRTMDLSGSGGFWRKAVMGLVVCIVLAAGIGTVFAVSRSSTNYAITIDAVAAAGGMGLSLSYAEADSCVGEGAPCGLSSSASYSNHAGVVQSWGGSAVPGS